MTAEKLESEKLDTLTAELVQLCHVQTERCNWLDVPQMLSVESFKLPETLL